MGLSIGHIQYLSFCRSLTSIILRNRAPVVEKSIQIILQCFLFDIRDYIKE